MILDNIHNHYESLVYEEIQRRLAAEKGGGFTDNALEDVACLALNHLPARYVRHSVDIAFYLTPKERADMDQQVLDAVAAAFDLVILHPHQD